MYGSVSECLKNNAYFEIHKSSNKFDFCNYMKNLEKQIVIKPGGLKPVLVLDNLMAHKG